MGGPFGLIASICFWATATFAMFATIALGVALNAVYVFCNCVAMTSHSCDDTCNKLKTWVWAAAIAMGALAVSSVGAAILWAQMGPNEIAAMLGLGIGASVLGSLALAFALQGATCQTPPPGSDKNSLENGTGTGIGTGAGTGTGTGTGVGPLPA